MAKFANHAKSSFCACDINSFKVYDQPETFESTSSSVAESAEIAEQECLTGGYY